MKPKNVPSIFILDDDVLSLAFAQQTLKHLGYPDTHLFLHSDQLFNALTKEVPDIIFLDYNMQPYNGIDMLYCIKKRYPSVKIIFLSSEEDPKIAADVLQYGAVDFISKGLGAISRIGKMMEQLSNEMCMIM